MFTDPASPCLRCSFSLYLQDLLMKCIISKYYGILTREEKKEATLRLTVALPPEHQIAPQIELVLL